MQSRIRGNSIPLWRQNIMRQASLRVLYNPSVASGRTQAGDFSLEPTPASIEVDELPWLGRRVPNGYWDTRHNRLLYLNWLGRQCGFTKPEDWYGLRKHHFQQHGGGGLFRNEYQSSVLKAMRDFLPNYDWKPWLFGGAPNGYWKVRENRVRYMNWLGELLNIKQPEDWYHVTGADFFNNHGGGLLNNHFNASVQALVADFLPDFDWKPWCFASVPQSYWRSQSHRREYLSWLGGQLGFQKSGDWSRLKREHFYRNGGSGLLVSYYHGSARMAVREYF